MTQPYALGTFSEGDCAAWAGVVRDSVVVPLSALLPEAPETLAAVFLEWETWRDRIDEAVATAVADIWRPEADLRVHLPFRPENLYGAGANYFKHVVELIVDRGAGGLQQMNKEERYAFATKMMTERRETGNPYVFVAARSSVAGARDTLVVPYDSTEPDWELELAVVIGHRARRVAAADALDHVAGYTIANDITSREKVDRPDVPAMGMDWMSCKNTPGYKILGPYVTPARFVPDPQKLHIRLKLNGDTMQDEGTSDMIFGVAKIIEFISASVALEPGDIVMTGSPSGNGTHYDRFLRDGDVMTGEIDGLLGAQMIPCVLEAAI